MRRRTRTDSTRDAKPRLHCTCKDYRVAVMKIKGDPDETIKYGLEMNEEVGQ